MRATTVATSLLVAVLVGCSITLPNTQVEPPAPVVTAVPEPELRLVSGTIRWASSTQWVVLDDAAHTSEGIESVQLLADRVRVHYTFDGEKVSSLQVTSDEAFTSANVRVGASVGLSYADVFFYMPSYGSRPVPPALLSKQGANVWITGALLDIPT